MNLKNIHPFAVFIISLLAAFAASFFVGYLIEHTYADAFKMGWLGLGSVVMTKVITIATSLIKQRMIK